MTKLHMSFKPMRSFVLPTISAPVPAGGERGGVRAIGAGASFPRKLPINPFQCQTLFSKDSMINSNVAGGPS
jgi:hypothetical protein